MKCLLSILLLASLSSASHASDKTYNWVLKQYANNNTSEISSHTDGQIYGNRYIAIITNRTSTTQDYDPTIIIFKEDKAKFSVIAKVDLQGDYADGYNVTIQNDSIYLAQWAAHHGVFGIRYQFKQINNEFKMIGAEDQSQISGCYAGSDTDDCGKYDFWSGTSYNFLTSSSICWQKTINSHDEKGFAEASRKLEMFLRPNSGMIHQMTFPPVKLQLLNGFDFSNAFLPSSCYFDSKNKLQLVPVRS